MNTFVASWVPPDHHIVGMVVRHGEAFTITEKLTVWQDGKAVYRPTVHYAYCPVRLGHRRRSTSCAAATTTCSPASAS